MFGQKLKPEDVFTPKGAVVNPEMYIARPQLESALDKAIRKPKHIIIHGESGSGKTWLYKNLFKQRGIKYEVLNSASIITSGSIIGAIKSLVAKRQPVKNTGFEETKSASANALFAEGGLEHMKKYEYQTLDPFFELVKNLGDGINKLPAFLVIENVEHIVKVEEYIKELSALLLYLDDEQYSKFNVRILVVGTPSDIRNYFAAMDNGQTIVNRVQEIPEVSVLTDEQTASLVKKGLITKLKYIIVEERDRVLKDSEPYLIDKLQKDISWYTANIPQHIHELCLDLSLDAELNNNEITESMFYSSLFTWLKGSLISEHSTLEQNVNSVETKHGRKNQVIYAISKIWRNEFDYKEIETEVRKLFPNSTSGKTLNVSGVLKELSMGKYPIIRKIPKRARYRFIDPKIQIMCRWMLVKKTPESEIIIIREFDDNIRSPFSVPKS